MQFHVKTMPKLCDINFPDKLATPEGFWSAVEVWIQKPHVVNKRLCGVKLETEGKQVDIEELGHILQAHRDGASEINDVFAFLGTNDSEFEHGKEGVWSYCVRTFIPKVNCYGTNTHKEMILKDFDSQRVTFIPFEEETEGRISQRNGNIYQLRLRALDGEEWVLELHVFSPAEWLSDGVAYPTLPWLSRELLPRLVRWATEKRTSDFPSTLSLLPVEKYSVTYQRLKDKYKDMVKVWPEVTDPEKFVYEDVAIATYLLVLWGEERAELDLTDKQSFVDLGCGNGLLVHILSNEGHPGKGIDVRRRKIWDMYGPQTLLEETAITPGDGFLFPSTDWLIGNHSDELTPWIPVIAARSSYGCRYFVLPCCFFDFYAKYQRRQCGKSQYQEYIAFISEVSAACGFHTQEDCLRIPSTKRVCLVGRSRTYERTEEAEAEQRRARYIQGRQPSPRATAQRTEVAAAAADKGSGEAAGSQHEHAVDTGETNDWGAGFRPRERVEVVRNCAALPRALVDGVVLRVAGALLGLNTDQHGTWNLGGSLLVREVAELLEAETLQSLKKECGGLQTLLRNNHQVFRVEGGRVHIRDWRAPPPRRPEGERARARRPPPAPGALKTRPCWFHRHHPHGCPLRADNCAFAHGAGDLRPSTKPLKKKNMAL